MLEQAEARTLLDSVDVTTPIGLCDRVPIALMVHSFRMSPAPRFGSAMLDSEFRRRGARP